MSELRNRLEALATRGTRRGADDVLRAAQRDAQTASSDENPADLDGTDMQIIDDDLPVVTLGSGSRRRRRFGSFVASAGVAALIGVGALAVTAMFGSGGAGTPEGAVRQLAEAVNNKDALAAVDVLVPSEVRSMRDSVEHITERAAELHIVDEASKPLAGVDLSVDHLELRTEPLADGYAKVIITSGEFSASTHRAELSALLQKAQRDGEDAQNHADLAKLAGDSGPTFVVVVRQGGGWYVSPAYTTLEYIREANEYPAADFGSANAAELGAATPDDAVKDALHAWQASDWDRLIALAPPDELPLYDYRAMIAAAGADADVKFTIDHLSTTSTQSGDTAIVKLDASGTSGDDGGKWQVGGSCATFQSESSSSDSAPNFCLSGDQGVTLPIGLMFYGEGTTSPTSGPVSISVVRESGRWFVSPVTTVLGLVDATVRNIDQRGVYTLLGIAYDLPPDGTITLNQPFEVAATTPGWLSSRVYAFEGRAGQDVVGEMSGVANPTAARSESDYAYGTIYSADGDPISSVEFQRLLPTAVGDGYYYVSSARLPATGSYRLVIQPAWARSNDAMTLTLWNLADAPEKLRESAHSNNIDNGNFEECASSGGFLQGGSEACEMPVTSTTISGATDGFTAYPEPATTSSTNPGSSGSSSSSGSSTATTAPATSIP